MAVTIILVVILLTNRLVQFMADAASGDIPPSAIATLLGLKAAANIGVVLPGSFFLAVVLVFGRLYRDAEMTAMAGCGIGPLRVYRGIFALAVPLSVVVGALTISLGPAAERAADQVLADARSQAQFAGLQPGQFLSFDNSTTAYVAAMQDDGLMSEVFVERRVDGDTQIWVADRGRRVVNGLGRGEFLVLEQGWRYQGSAGEPAWQLMQYAEHGVRIAEPVASTPGVALNALSLADLWQRDEVAARAELQQRVLFPLMVLVLAAASLPLAKTDPRSGRYGRVVVAVLLFMVYFNLLFVAQDWWISAVTPAWLGLGWVHVLAGVLVLAALRIRLGLSWPRQSA